MPLKKALKYSCAICLLVALMGCTAYQQPTPITVEELKAKSGNKETVATETPSKGFEKEYTIDEENSGESERWLEDITIENEKEAETLLLDQFQNFDEGISICFAGSSSNNCEIWYDFVEKYNGFPIWGNPIRVHTFKDYVIIQGNLISGNFEETDDFISEKEAIVNHAGEEYANQYVLVEVCYLKVMGTELVPLCYHFAGDFEDVFINVSTGELVSERSNIIIG